MMSPKVLRAVNAEIAAEAAQSSRVPYVPFDAEEPQHWPPFPFPNLGRVPEGWEVAERFFVDKTGWGRRSEPALTIDEFRTFLYDHILDHPNHGYAIIEEGPSRGRIAPGLRSAAANSR